MKKPFILFVILGLCFFLPAKAQSNIESKIGDTVIINGFRDPGMIVESQLAGGPNYVIASKKSSKLSNKIRKGKFLYQNVIVNPNPVVFNASIKLPNFARLHVEIWNDEGKTVFQKENVNGKSLQNLDFSALRPGDYEGRVVVMFANRAYSFKMTKL